MSIYNRKKCLETMWRLLNEHMLKEQIMISSESHTSLFVVIRLADCAKTNISTEFVVMYTYIERLIYNM